MARTTDEKLFQPDETQPNPIDFTKKREETPTKKKTVNEQLFEDDREPNAMSARDKRDMMMLQEVYSKKDIEMKSELGDTLIQAVTKGILFADHFQVPIMHDLCMKLLELRVSKNRGGRKEFVDMARSMNSNEMDSGGYDIGKRLFGVEK